MADAKGVKWYGKEFHKTIDQGLLKNVSKAGQIVYDEVRELVSKPGRSVETVVSKSGKTRKKYGKKGEFTSKPGEPPLKQTGRLRRSIKKKLFRKQLKVRILDKGRALEFGTSKMEARPHLRAALQKMRRAVAAALGQRIN